MEREIEVMEKVFKALADRTRLRILGLLMTGEVCVCDIHTSLKITQPKTSRHLAYLKRAGLVEDRKDGLWVYYKLAPPANDLLCKILSSVGCCLDSISSTAEDRKRLEAEIGCCLSNEEAAPTVHLL